MKTPTSRHSLVPVLLPLLAICGSIAAADYPAPTPADLVLRDFRFRSGESLPEVRIHYVTLGAPRRDESGRVNNAVLVLHGTGGSSASLLNATFAGELFGTDQPLDAKRFYVILVDSLGHGASSKPSDGQRAGFPRYGYHDMVEAQYRLLTEGLGVDHLRLVIGTSMGGMHTWLWGEEHPDFMDALLPLASLPTAVSGRNRVWRKMIIDAIRDDPGWNGGNYQAQPRNLKVAVQMLYFMSMNPVMRQKQAPTLAKADEVLAATVRTSLERTDANDLLYALESSFDYDPGPGLEKIRAPLVAINSADDLINPPELGILEKEIARVKGGRAIVVPLGEETAGHQTHTRAAVWKRHLIDLLARTEKSPH